MSIPAVSDSDARQELGRVLASSIFAASSRHRRFLSYVVDEALAGRGDRIKAYTIATMALGRGDDFDPQTDTIVRIEAGRLRRALDHYYLAEGSQNPFRILVPKGSYVPRFVPAEAEKVHGEGAPVPRADAKRRGPRIFVAPFEMDVGSDALPDFGRGFTRQVITGLTRFSTLFVYGAETVEMLWDDRNKGRLPGKIAVDFLLTGSISVTPESFAVEVLLQVLPEGRFVWADRFEGDAPPGLVRARDAVAGEVVRKLAQPYGVLFSRSLDPVNDAPERLGSYRDVIDFYRYWRGFDRALYEPVRAGLESAIADDPTFAEAYACLARHYANAGRFALHGVTEMANPLGRARQLADKAVRLASHSSAAHHALGLVRWFSGDVEGSLAAYRTAISLNPHDTDLVADLGLRCAMRMDWQAGVPLIEESYLRNPCQPTTYRVGLFLYHFSEGRYAEALD